MVEPRGRRLNPLEPAAPDDFVPRHRPLFGMAAENIGVEYRFRNSLLPGIDDGRPRLGGLNLRDVLRFDGIAEDDIHSGSRYGVQGSGSADHLDPELVSGS